MKVIQQLWQIVKLFSQKFWSKLKELIRRLRPSSTSNPQEQGADVPKPPLSDKEIFQKLSPDIRKHFEGIEYLTKESIEELLGGLLIAEREVIFRELIEKSSGIFMPAAKIGDVVDSVKMISNVDLPDHAVVQTVRLCGLVRKEPEVILWKAFVK